MVPGPRFGKFSETCLTYISALELFSLSIWTCGGRMRLNSTYRCSSIVKRLPIHDIDHRPPPVWTRRELRESNGPQMSGCHWPTGWVGGPESSERLSGMMSDTSCYRADCLLAAGWGNRWCVSPAVPMGLPRSGRVDDIIIMLSLHGSPLTRR